MNRLQLKQDALYIKWHLLILTITVIGGPASYLGATYFQDQMNRQELGAQTNVAITDDLIRRIEEEEATIVANIGRFQAMSDDGVLEPENRVAILERLRMLREQHNLFSIAIDISEQERNVLPLPENLMDIEEQISLRGTRIGVNLSLLHEEDLTRFYTGFMDTGRLMFPLECRLLLTLIDESSFLNVAEHQSASCDFMWYTLRREPYVEPEY